MASPKSIYNKIHYVLVTANGPDVSDKGKNIIEVLISENPSIFFTYQFNDISKENELRLSEKVINNTVDLCKEDLGLLTTDYQLSEAGKSALKEDEFGYVLAHQIFRFFEKYDYNVNDINEVIQDSFKQDIFAEQPPTSNFIWEKTECPINRHLFSRILTLLCHCGFAVSSQKKIYLKVKFPE